MSFKASLVKTAINLTPKAPIRWVANLLLKEIAEIQALEFDIDARTAFVQIQLYGEAEAIEIAVDNFGISQQEGTLYFELKQAQSNKPWMSNILAKVTSKTWKIPNIPKFQAHIDLLAEVLQSKNTASE